MCIIRVLYNHYHREIKMEKHYEREARDLMREPREELEPEHGQSHSENLRRCLEESKEMAEWPERILKDSK